MFKSWKTGGVGNLTVSRDYSCLTRNSSSHNCQEKSDRPIKVTKQCLNNHPKSSLHTSHAYTWMPTSPKHTYTHKNTCTRHKHTYTHANIRARTISIHVRLVYGHTRNWRACASTYLLRRTNTHRSCV